MQKGLRLNIFDANENSKIAKVNNLIKLQITILLYIILATLNYNVFAIVFFIVFIVYVYLGYNYKSFFKIVISIVFLSMFLFIYFYIIYFNSPEQYNIGFIHIPKEAVQLFFVSLKRISSITFPIFLYLFSSSISQLEYGLNTYLSPLNKIKIPVSGIVMILVLSLSLIPITFREVKRILLVQAIRGSDFKTQKFSKKVSTITYMLIPILISSLKKAEQLSYSIEIRKYDPFKIKSFTYINKMTSKDRYIFIILLIISIVIIILNLIV